jgi:hypothetical protein
MTSLLTHPSTALKCRLCKKGRYAPPVYMINLNVGRSGRMCGFIPTTMIGDEDYGLIASAVGAYSN